MPADRRQRLAALNVSADIAKAMRLDLLRSRKDWHMRQHEPFDHLRNKTAALRRIGIGVNAAFGKFAPARTHNHVAPVDVAARSGRRNIFDIVSLDDKSVTAQRQRTHQVGEKHSPSTVNRIQIHEVLLFLLNYGRLIRVDVSGFEAEAPGLDKLQ